MRWLACLIYTFLLQSVAAEETYPSLYPEGPIWIGEKLFWAEMTGHRVMLLQNGRLTTFFHERGCGPTSLAPLSGSRIVILCHLDGSLRIVDGAGQVLKRVSSDQSGRPLRDPNDVTSDGEGGAWLTDPGLFLSGSKPEGALLHLSADAILERVVDGLAYGNGVHLTQDALLLSEHLARRVLSFPRHSERLGVDRVVINLDTLSLKRGSYPETGPDGLEQDRDGRLWVAEYGAGRLLVFGADFQFLGQVPVDTQFVTNVAFDRTGKMAITGAFQNAQSPFEGKVTVTTTDVMLAKLRKVVP